MTPAARYREIEVYGTPREMGRQLGEAAGEEIRGFASIAVERVNKTVSISREQALATASACIPYVADYAPELLAELRGTAESSGVSLEELMLLQVRNQLRNRPDTGHPNEGGCTALATRRPALVAQNWDSDPALDPYTVVVTRRPLTGPATLTVGQAGLIGYIGCGERGIGVCLNTLPAPSREVGVPHYFIVRRVLEADSLDAAAGAVRSAHRAIPANLILATPQGPADFEILIDDLHVLRPDEGADRLTHTNHCLHPALTGVNERFPELIESRPRKRRIDALLDGAEGGIDVGVAQAALRDHRDEPRSICRHANDDPGHGFWTSVFWVVIEADACRMHVSRGNPCSNPYEEYRLTA
ncbi:MAG: C45 family autoproteolytic acyltransferase/hydrolase [Spirochaetaceae bacterium]|nr:C45 family autoproteolytic acyltransferase/hydrolase [Spirochaetaceae bacterium]